MFRPAPAILRVVVIKLFKNSVIKAKRTAKYSVKSHDVKTGPVGSCVVWCVIQDCLGSARGSPESTETSRGARERVSCAGGSDRQEHCWTDRDCGATVGRQWSECLSQCPYFWTRAKGFAMGKNRNFTLQKLPVVQKVRNYYTIIETGKQIWLTRHGIRVQTEARHVICVAPTVMAEGITDLTARESSRKCKMVVLGCGCRSKSRCQNFEWEGLCYLWEWICQSRPEHTDSRITL